MANLNITVEKRDILGKKVSNLRKAGITPLHLYGSGIDPQSLQCDTVELSKIISQAGTNIPVTIKVSGSKDDSLCFIREVQYHPVTDRLIHVDFFRVDVEKSVRAEVPIMLEGTSPAVRSAGGTLLQPLQTVTVEALPLDVPASLILQADLLIDFETKLYVSDIAVDSSIQIINDSEELVASVVAPRVEREGFDESAVTEESVNEESSDSTEDSVENEDESESE
ncbi:MAG: 50S ribosomal protein L25 [Chloroflexi bacterium]|nr:50S ribosomal protein L25 [Chloroflexota bacterium]|tara:strand:- start:3823 stop:4494 length:672 start_codon:yes stop_codon:yes gene_type:complete